jgi:protein-S-isoprenylcysteine O-methyltransferase Ste14
MNRLDDKGRTRSIMVRFVQMVVSLLIPAGLFFVAAGRLDLPRAWIFYITSLVYMLISGAVMVRINPEIVGERSKVKKGAKGWDKVLVSLYPLIGLALYVIAGLDIRFHWSSPGFYFFIPAMVLYIAASLLIQWAIAVNRHFEGMVRIQDDRNHRVISTGPYRIVRHPGYLAIIVQNLLFPLIIRSAFSFIPACGILIVFIVRTCLEDTTLLKELDGYADYARKVRYRLFPGIW